LPNGVDVARFAPARLLPLRAVTREQLGLGQAVVYLASAFNLWLKGVDTAMHALAQLAGAGADVRLVVAGGVPAGLSPWETLLKEAGEEAGLPAELVAPARAVATLDYAMERPEGLRRDRLQCYDLMLPESFVPEARDGEVESFELWPMQDVLDRVRATDDFKFNVSLVLIDLFRRLGMLPRG